METISVVVVGTLKLGPYGKGYCPGAGTDAERTGAKLVNGRYRYKCPHCGKLYTKDGSGRVAKHGYTLNATPKVAARIGFCGSCGRKREIPEDDYMCVKCRSK